MEREGEREREALLAVAWPLGLLYGEKSNRGESAPIALFTTSQQILAGCMASPLLLSPFLSSVSSYKSEASKRAHAAEISVRARPARKKKRVEKSANRIA